MKKQTENNFPNLLLLNQVVIFSFLKGKILFAEKHYRTKEILSRTKLPEGFGSKSNPPPNQLFPRTVTFTCKGVLVLPTPDGK
jgi:hypothetical protein